MLFNDTFLVLSGHLHCNGPKEIPEGEEETGKRGKSKREKFLLYFISVLFKTLTDTILDFLTKGKDMKFTV